MAFQGLQLRFIRFLGPTKEPAEFIFTTGLNILWGSSDTGKTFLVQAIDFMLGAGKLRDIPERVGYDRILLGITTAGGKDYTIQRSIDGGSFRLFDGLVFETPQDKKAGKNLSAVHTIKNYNNLSHWLLREVGLDQKQILWSSSDGVNRSLGFRALAHLCVIVYPKITQDISPLYDGQYQDQTREYGVFKLLLTGIDDSAITPEVTAELEETKPVTKPPVRPDVIEEMINTYEEELATLTENPEGLDAAETALDEAIDKVQFSMRVTEGQLTLTSQQRKEVYDRHSTLTARENEITELQERFKLLDAQYTNDIKRLVAIEESGQLFVLREPMACPLCGAQPQNQDHNAACDGNVAAVTQAAAAEIAKIRLLQSELQGTFTALTKEHVEIVVERKTLAGVWQGYKDQIDTALSPDFSAARKEYDALVEKRAKIRQADVVYTRIKALRRRLDEPAPAPTTKAAKEKEESTDIEQYIPKSVLREFSKTVENILSEWHFPDATDVYFDEKTRDVVIGGRPRGSRGAGLCAITYSAFTLALFEFCRSREMAHPGFVVLDSPLLAYKEPEPGKERSSEDEEISGSDLKLRFYEHLEQFAGNEQIFIVDHTEPPPNFVPKATHFTNNPAIPRCGLFPHLKKPRK
jgi:hypothetical protein